MEYFGKPFPFYYLGNVFTSGVHQQQGIAGNLVEKVNSFLETRGKTGILYNAISPYLKAHGMYERRGWTPISGRSRWLIYNPTPRITEEMMRRAVDQIDRHDE
ncbi:hypothetical protein HY418_02205 [Candidatus Kaiserbacteria bacterium]|nr:hypothetical protein [Candidatus Kaiserbacteria bacterium]